MAPAKLSTGCGEASIRTGGVQLGWDKKKMDHEELGCNWALSMVTLCFFRIIMVGDFNSPEKKKQLI